MPSVERVTVTLPVDLIRDIDRQEKNRSKFVAEAVRFELDRRRREGLRLSLRHPHPESLAFADEGFEAWSRSLPEEDVEGLINANACRPIRWIAGEGWVEGH